MRSKTVGTTDPRRALRGEEGPTVFHIKIKKIFTFRYAANPEFNKMEGK